MGFVGSSAPVPRWWCFTPRPPYSLSGLCWRELQMCKCSSLYWILHWSHLTSWFSGKRDQFVDKERLQFSWEQSDKARGWRLVLQAGNYIAMLYLENANKYVEEMFALNRIAKLRSSKYLCTSVQAKAEKVLIINMSDGTRWCWQN